MFREIYYRGAEIASVERIPNVSLTFLAQYQEAIPLSDYLYLII